LPVLRFRVVLDEGHIIRNESTQTAKAAYALKSKYRWIMSGTPIQNRSVSPRSLASSPVQQIVCGGVQANDQTDDRYCSLDDMYSLLRFLHVPECMDKAWWRQNVAPAGDFTALKVPTHLSTHAIVTRVCQRPRL
jgi:hypothetical protein